MEGAPTAKKRRIPKACAGCRGKKLACDERRPCSRCTKAGIECIYSERPKDPHLERIERLEGELERLRQRLDTSSVYSGVQTSPSIGRSTESIGTAGDANAPSGWDNDPGLGLPCSGVSTGESCTAASRSQSTGTLAAFKVRQTSSFDVVSAGYVLEADARLWFSTFFEGCDRFVPVFDLQDTFDSVRTRSSILFDIILIFGARATHGALSRPHQRLYGLLREHTSDLVLRLTGRTNVPTAIEDIQALLVIASYSDSGGILCDVALRASLEAGLPSQLDTLFSKVANHALQASPIDRSLYVSARVWYYLFVLDMILSIDGGKPPSVTMQTSPQRVRSLLHHPERTTLDIRLLAQVELNVLRATAHASIATHAELVNLDDAVEDIVIGAILDLDLWLAEWQSIVRNDESLGPERIIMNLNLRIQHAWALLTLHLRALTASGIENIALMSNEQRNIALSAKEAAEQHLQLLLTDKYVANFRFAMEFVWAKNVFCVLIVLRLGILLGESPDHLHHRLAEAKEFLHELGKINMGANVSYVRILAEIVKKCEKAINSSLQSGSERSSAEPGDFQTFIPKEFMFEWNFPGLHLYYIPIDWQDLFLDFGATA